jgi:phage repressor protein C with HTH and peptisase S24 domain
MKTDNRTAVIRRERLRLLVSEVSQTELSKRARMSLSQIGQWLSGERNISEMSARRIEIAASKARGWMDATSEPSESTRPPSDADWNARPESLVRLRRHLVPVVGKAKLGDDGYFAELEYPVGHGDGYVDCPTDDPNAYALHCVGSSMLPRIKPGEFVVMEPGREVVPGDEVLVRSTDGRVMVKELLYIRDGQVHLGSVNDNQPKLAIPIQEIDRMHYVAAIVKRARWTPDYEPERRVANVEPNPQRRIGEANWNFPGTTETENTPKADSLRAPERGA